jgi:RNA polymerase sigma factor (sigma-70 family)
MQSMDDSALLRQFVGNRSDEAFSTLVTRHVNLVYSVAMRHVGNQHQAEEITQAVFIILAKKAGGLRHDKALSSWLFQATRLTANNFVRSEMRRHRREQEAHMQSQATGPDSEVWPLIAPLLDTAVASLNERDRRAIVLRFYEGRNLREVGVALGANEEAAKKRVARAVERLQKFFFKRGVDSTADAITGAIAANSIQIAPALLAKSVTAVAFAKGATASISTLTLIKGALKIMAWTKTKTAIVASVVAILGIGTTTVVVEALLPAPDIQGTWEGTLDLPGWGVQAGQSPNTQAVLKIRGTNGDYQATADMISLGVKDVPFSSFTYKFPHVHGEIPRRHASYDGTVNRAGTVISGTINLNYSSMPGTNYSESLVFQRTDHPTSFPEPLTDAEFAPRAGSDLQGFWTGVIKFGKAELHMNIKIAESPNGTFRADSYSPDQDTNRQPTSVSYDGTTVKIMPMAGFGMFQGTLSNGGKEMSGDWIQNGQRIPTTFTRINSSASPILQPALTAWQRGDKAAAVSNFLAADLSDRPLFASDSALSLSENQLDALPLADLQAKSGEVASQLDSLKGLARAVIQDGDDAVAKGDTAQARKCFTAVQQCGEALDSTNCPRLAQFVGQALKKRAQSELAKIGP